MKIDELLDQARPVERIEECSIKFSDLNLSPSEVVPLRQNKTRKFVVGLVAASFVATVSIAANIVLGHYEPYETWVPIGISKVTADDRPMYYNYQNSKPVLAADDWMTLQLTSFDARGNVVQVDTSFDSGDGRYTTLDWNASNDMSQTPPPKSEIGKSVMSAPWIATLPEPTADLQASMDALYQELVRQINQLYPQAPKNEKDMHLVTNLELIVESQVASARMRLVAISLANHVEGTSQPVTRWSQIDADGRYWMTISNDGRWSGQLIDVETPGVWVSVLFREGLAPVVENLDSYWVRTAWAITQDPTRWPTVGVNETPAWPIEKVVSEVSRLAALALQ